MPGASPDKALTTVRPARAGDAAALSELFGQLGYPAAIDEVRARLATRCGAGNARCLVAEQGGVAVGVATVHLLEPLHVPGPWALLSSLVVCDTLRGGGIGATLLDAAARLAWEAGCSHLELSSNDKRLRAHAFYERHGFEEVRKRFVKRRPASWTNGVG